MSRSSWHTGDYLTHRFNPELGIGRVTRLEPRTLLVEFPRAGKTLRLAAGTDALIAVDLSPGRPVRIIETREETSITAIAVPMLQGAAVHTAIIAEEMAGEDHAE